MLKKEASIFKGAMLIAGTAIGGGILALPILTGIGGFYPSLLIYVASWAFMASTGLLFLELCDWFSYKKEEDTHLISMAQATLGKGGKIAAWFLYLFLFFCLTLAYVVGIGGLFAEALGILPIQGSFLLLLLSLPIFFVGPSLAGKVNLLFMGGLLTCFFLFMVLGVSHIDFSLLTRSDFSMVFMALPISFTAFAYQGTVPTLYNYMGKNIKRARKALLIGSFIPLVVYILWQILILGIVPLEGEGGLLNTLALGETAVYPLKFWVQNPYLIGVGKLFAFFALVTSFIGVVLGLIDFLADGLTVPKNNWGKIVICFLIFAPVLMVAILNPHVFLIALDFAGGFGCALLLGLFPILMVWQGRYRKGLHSKHPLPGGKGVLIALSLFVALELICQWLILG